MPSRVCQNDEDASISVRLVPVQMLRTLYCQESKYDKGNIQRFTYNLNTSGVTSLRKFATIHIIVMES